MFRKLQNIINEWIFPEQNIDIKDGPFPDTKDFVIFQAIQDMCAGKATVEDLHRAVLAGGNEALEKTISIENIIGPEEQWIWGPMHSTYKGKHLTPLHYAFLTDRQDAFSLLMADGADIDKEFFIQRMSKNAEENETSNITGTLQSFMLRYNAYTLMDPFMALAVRHAYFLALLQRKEVSKLIDILMFEIRLDYQSKLEHLNLVSGAGGQNRPVPDYMRTENYQARRMFRTVPSVEQIQHAAGEMDPSYTQTLTKIVSELTKFNHDAQRKKGYFITYTDEATKIVQEQINLLIECFTSLHQHLDTTLTSAGYQWGVLNTLLADCRHYNRDHQKNEYLDGIKVKFDHSCYWLGKEGDNLESDPRTLLKTLISFASGSVNNIDTDLYRETLLELVRGQLLMYANGLHDKCLQDSVDRLTALKLPVSAEQLTHELKFVMELLDHPEKGLHQNASTSNPASTHGTVSISDAHMANSVFGRKRPDAHNNVRQDNLPVCRR
jgi:hypothetical protein